MSTPTPTPSPDKVEQAESGLAKAKQEIVKLTGHMNAGTLDTPTLESGLAAVSTAINSVPTHKPN